MSKKSRFLKRVVVVGMIFLVFIGLTACFSVKTSTTRSAKKSYETFYVGQGGLQYFIKPLEFIGRGGKDKLYVDFTFQCKSQIKDSAIVNFSIYNDKIYRSIEQISFNADDLAVESKTVGLLFNEKRKDIFISRFSTKISLKDLTHIFRKDQFDIYIKNNQEMNFQMVERTIKNVNFIRDNVFILFND